MNKKRNERCSPEHGKFGNYLECDNLDHQTLDIVVDWAVPITQP